MEIKKIGEFKKMEKLSQMNEKTLKEKNHTIAAYAGYIENEFELLECTSGGVATALAREMIRQGGYVAGVSYSSDFYKAQYEIINEEKEISKFKGSKYIEVDKGSIFNDVKTLLEKGEKVLFFGLPCVVAAIRKFIGKEYDEFIAVELICHGPTSNEVHLQYVKSLEERYHSKIVDFTVRKKEQLWLPIYLYARFENGQEYRKKFYSTEYGYAFSVMPMKHCLNCIFKGDNRTGDLMIGDFWGANSKDEFWNSKGVSAILVHTQKGHQFLKKIQSIKLFPTTFDRIVEENRNILQRRKSHVEGERFKILFQKKGLFYAAKHTRTIKRKIKIFLVRLVPNFLKPILKKYYHKLK